MSNVKQTKAIPLSVIVINNIFNLLNFAKDILNDADKKLVLEHAKKVLKWMTQFLRNVALVPY